jgi:hypothetical protein
MSNNTIVNKLNDIIRLLNELENKYCLIKMLFNKKGKMCSVNGNAYEKKIYNVIKNLIKSKYSLDDINKLPKQLSFFGQT